MTPSPNFIVKQAFKNCRPELARTYAFQQQTSPGTKDSEIWCRLDPSEGYWISRIDAMGHGTGKVVLPKAPKPGQKSTPNYFCRGWPHYHKNWVDSKVLLERYCREFVPEAWIYAETSELICMAGDNTSLHPDKKTELQNNLR